MIQPMLKNENNAVEIIGGIIIAQHLMPRIRSLYHRVSPRIRASIHKPKVFYIRSITFFRITSEPKPIDPPFNNFRCTLLLRTSRSHDLVFIILTLTLLSPSLPS